MPKDDNIAFFYQPKKYRQLTVAIDGITISLTILSVLLFAVPWNWFIPWRTYLRFIYIIPLIILTIYILKLPVEIFSYKAWYNLCLRLKFSAVFLCFLSPFLIWWLNVVDNLYFFLNAAILVFSFIYLFFNLNGMIILLSRIFHWNTTGEIGLFCRLGIIYLTITPVLAFFVTSLFAFGRLAGREVFNYIWEIANWKFCIIALPLFAVLVLLYIAREKTLMKDTEIYKR